MEATETVITKELRLGDVFKFSRRNTHSITLKGFNNIDDIFRVLEVSAASAAHCNIRVVAVVAAGNTWKQAPKARPITIFNPTWLVEVVARG